MPAGVAKFSQPFTRISIQGTLFGVESWSINLSVTAGTAAGRRPTQADADAVLTAWRNFMMPATARTSGIGNKATLTQVKMARLGTDGLYTDPEPTVALQATTGNTGNASGSNFHAPQIALAVTLEGRNPRARAGRGRVFLPAIVAGLGTDGRISSGDALSIANAFSTFVNDANAALDGVISVVGPHTDKTQGAVQAVTRVGVGRTLDTIRSRRAAVAEERQWSATTIVESQGNAIP